MKNYGFSDAADLFVFISGYTVALVYARTMAAGGFVVAAVGILARAWNLYVAHILLFVVYVAAIGYVAQNHGHAHLLDEFNIRRLITDPIEFLKHGLLLQFKPLNLDVLPLYTALMATFPPFLWLLMRTPGLALAVSFAIYAAARTLNWNLASYPDGVWYFNPFAWQFLFVIGAWISLDRTGLVRRLTVSRPAVWSALLFLLLSFAVTLAARFGFASAMPAPIADLFLPNDKTNLAPYRILHFLALALIVARLVPQSAPALNLSVLRPAIICGERSLEVFCVGIFLSFASGVALAAAFAVGKAVPATERWAFLLAMLVGLIPIGRRAFSAARAGTPFSIEMLMSIAAVGAVFIGATEEAATVVFLFLIGELLEGVAASRARASIQSLTKLVPKTARLEENGELKEVQADSLEVGATIQIRPGDRIPADEVILSGESAIDEAPVTGESTPVRKGPDATLFAGTVNGDGLLRVRVTATAADNTIARVVRLVEEAQESKAPTDRFIDRFSRYYTPGVVVVAALVAVSPPLMLGSEWSGWIYKGLAILLIGCPCALVISTPAAVAASLSAGARRGLLLKGGAVLEQIGKVTVACFDKTGTLTAGKLQVTDIIAVRQISLRHSNPVQVIRSLLRFWSRRQNRISRCRRPPARTRSAGRAFGQTSRVRKYSWDRQRPSRRSVI